MKTGTQDKAEGNLHQMKGIIKESVGKAVGNPDLETSGKIENLKGKIQEKRGQIKKVLDK